MVDFKLENLSIVPYGLKQRLITLILKMKRINIMTKFTIVVKKVSNNKISEIECNKKKSNNSKRADDRRFRKEIKKELQNMKNYIHMWGR